MSLTRRSFLKHSTSAAAAVTLSGGITQKAFASSAPALAPGPCNKWPGRVAINFNKKATSGTTINTDIVKKMVDDAIMALTAKVTVGDAWKEIFPTSLSLQSKIAFKINTVNTSRPGLHIATVRAMTDGLQLMDFDGTKFPAENITLFDMSFSGTMEKSGFTKANFPGLSLMYTKLVDGGDGATIQAKDAKTGVEETVVNHQYASALRDADYLINVFTLRGHSTEFLPVGSKFTFGFKSHVGTYSSEASKEGPSLHGYLPMNLRAMNCTGPVYTKNVLSFCSALFGMNEGNGPPGSENDYLTYAKSMDDSIMAPANAGTITNPTTILLSTDPVAVEMQSVKVIRINKSGKYGIDDMPPYLQASAGIPGKLDGTTYNIGIIDESAMDIRRVINDVTFVNRSPLPRSRNGEAKVVATPMRGNSSTFIEFRLPGATVGAEATIDIVAMNGTLVKRRRIAISGAANHFSWDNCNDGGAAASRGMYIVRVACGHARCSERFTLL
jgi:hypothetical protein